MEGLRQPGRQLPLILILRRLYGTNFFDILCEEVGLQLVGDIYAFCQPLGHLFPFLLERTILIGAHGHGL